MEEKKVQKRYNEEFKRQAVELLIRTIDPTLDTWFHVAGYHVSEESEPQSEVWAVHVAGDTKQPGIFRGIQAAVWNGELDIMNRLMADVQFRWSPQNSFTPLPWFLPSWNFFTLQDAVDFAVFAARTTIDTMRFLPRFSGQ